MFGKILTGRRRAKLALLCAPLALAAVSVAATAPSARQSVRRVALACGDTLTTSITLSSDLSYNDGHWEFEDSPNGKRCLVRVTFLVKEGQGMTQAVPIGVLTQGTHDGFLAAAKGVKNRATGK